MRNNGMKLKNWTREVKNSDTRKVEGCCGYLLRDNNLKTDI